MGGDGAVGEVSLQAMAVNVFCGDYNNANLF